MDEQQDSWESRRCYLGPGRDLKNVSDAFSVGLHETSLSLSHTRTFVCPLCSSANTLLIHKAYQAGGGNDFTTILILCFLPLCAHGEL